MAFLDKNGLQRFWEIILSKFVAKEEGKGLSSNDFTNEEKQKLANIDEDAGKVNRISDDYIDSVCGTALYTEYDEVL